MFVKFFFIKRQLNSSKTKVPLLIKIKQIYFSKILRIKITIGHTQQPIIPPQLALLKSFYPESSQSKAKN